MLIWDASISSFSTKGGVQNGKLAYIVISKASNFSFLENEVS